RRRAGRRQGTRGLPGNRRQAPAFLRCGGGEGGALAQGAGMMGVAELAQLLKGRMSGAEARFTGVSTDTRSIAKGDLFVALRGDRFDAHTFLDQARQAGAVAALVDARHRGEYPLPVVVVEDTKRALGELA